MRSVMNWTELNGKFDSPSQTEQFPSTAIRRPESVDSGGPFHKPFPLDSRFALVLACVWFDPAAS